MIHPGSWKTGEVPFQDLFTPCSVLLLALLLVIPSRGSLVAREGAGHADRPFSVGYHQENDGPWLNPFDGTDRYYTQGVGLSVTHRPQWANRIAEVLPFGAGTGRSGAGAKHAGMGYLFAHEMYTPDNLTESEPLVDDRPYAGYAYLGVAHDRATRGWRDHLQLDIGAVGPIVRAEEIQTYAHESWGGRNPEGWRNQIGNEPLLQLQAERRWRLGIGDTVAVQLLPTLGMDLGSILTQLRLGAILRGGFNLPDDFGPTRFGTPLEATGGARQGLGVFGFGGVSGRAVVYNRLVTGSPARARPGLEPLVGEVRVGGGVSVRIQSLSFEASYSQVVIGPEFTGQSEAHRFGSAVFAVRRFSSE